MTVIELIQRLEKVKDQESQVLLATTPDKDWVPSNSSVHASIDTVIEDGSLTTLCDFDPSQGI